MEVQSDAALQENGPFAWADSSGAGTQEQSRPVPRALVIYLRDGSSYGVTDCWLRNGNLHYLTNYGGENTISADMLDLQRTVDENAARGVSFVLRNQPLRAE